jgi:hypothetical protein
MKGSSKIMILVLISVLSCPLLSGQYHFSDFKELSQKITGLSTRYPDICSVKSIVKTDGGKDIWVISIGAGDKDSKPGIAILGGIEGSYILGTELAYGFAENLLNASTSPEVKSLLEDISFYVFPDVSPDGTEQYFSSPGYERNINTRSTDDDRDFANDEDPYEDLNNDGLITFIRVTDPAGTMIESEDDERVLVPADLSKGLKGRYKVYSEGIDNDKDGEFNEDGPGGVDFNKNFTYDYEEFGKNAGLNAVSEPETKAVADFLYDHFNIYATISFGPQNNLGLQARSSERISSGQPGGERQGQGQGQTSTRRPGSSRYTSIMRSDQTIYNLVSDTYKKITGMTGAPAQEPAPGNFVDWAYYHYGRYSFGTPGWWYPVERGKNAEVSFLKYAKEKKLNDVFVPWTEIKHPDFPDKKVEVGGIKPFVMNTPPDSMIGDLTRKNYDFIMAVAEMHPKLEYIDTNVENVGENLFRITLKVHNDGIFATCSEIGDINQWTRIMRITVEPTRNQTILSGLKVQRIPRLEGDKTDEFTWLISGKGPVKITAGALNVGTISKTFELK